MMLTIDDRTRRVRVAETTIARVTEGKMMLEKPPVPAGGSQCSRTPKITARTVPSQKSGTRDAQHGE